MPVAPYHTLKPCVGLTAGVLALLHYPRFKEFSAAFRECKDSFDVIINCVSAKVDFSGMMGMLAHDGVAVQVRDIRCFML